VPFFRYLAPSAKGAKYRSQGQARNEVGRAAPGPVGRGRRALKGRNQWHRVFLVASFSRVQLMRAISPFQGWVRD
jgi:hypothetical protein